MVANTEGSLEGDAMRDAEILDRINSLVEEEHALFGRSREGAALSDPEHTRLRSLEVALDQCWDLLRQRRAATASRRARP
jgi:hypothetical protein